jgi:hypothetical protein
MGTSTARRHVLSECRNEERRVVGLACRPADRLSREHIKHNGESCPAFWGRQEGDVTHPGGIRHQHGEALVEQVLGDGALGIGACRAGPARTWPTEELLVRL